MSDRIHPGNCVCLPCLGTRANSPTLSEALRIERERSAAALCLNVSQRIHLDTFTFRWNKDRAARGLPPLLAEDALTEGLRALVEMVTS